MGKEYQVLDDSAESKDAIRVEVTETETVQTQTKKVVTRKIIESTILTLELRKAEAIAKYDAEIAINQAMLADIDLATKDVSIIAKAEEVI